MVILLAIVLTLSLVVLLSFNYRTDKSRFEMNRLAEHNKQWKTVVKFLAIYPGLLLVTHIAALIIALLLVGVMLAQYHGFGGFAISFLVLVAAFLLARVLKRSMAVLVSKNLAFFTKYFQWCSLFSGVSFDGEPTISSADELLHIIKDGDVIDEQTKVLLENALNLRDQTIEKSGVKRDRIVFVRANDPLTLKFIDELFATGHRVFPVAQGSLDRVVGLLHLDDLMPIEQREKVLDQVMRKCPPPIESSAPIDVALRQMAEYHTTVLLMEKDDKVSGLITLSDIARILFRENTA
jgi:CBS domain containing-hemolysin-like protein